MMQAPVTVLQANTKRDTGKKAQYGNILAAKVGSETNFSQSPLMACDIWTLDDRHARVVE